MFFNPSSSVSGSCVAHREPEEEKSEAKVYCVCMHLLLTQMATWIQVESTLVFLANYWEMAGVYVLSSCPSITNLKCCKFYDK